MTTFLHRVTGAALLNPAIYEEVEADRTATMQAMAVVALAAHRQIRRATRLSSN